MGDELDVPWPPPPMATSRLIIRATQASDRPGCIELLCSAQVRRYLGGPRTRATLEAELPVTPHSRPGAFAAEAEGRFLGMVTVARRAASRPGHLARGGSELEISYTFLPDAWGHGYAYEAVTQVLTWIASAMPHEPVVLCTQVANARSVGLAERLGFVEAQRFEEFGAEQWFGVRDSG
ncbi:MAG: GNAT family N-acetyltransferase [Nocardioides sp.]